MRDRREEFDAGRIATTKGLPPEDFTAGAPAPIEPSTGMHKDYWVLSPSERAKGFVRPVRNQYKHVGIPGPTYPLRDLDDDEKERYAQYGYLKFEEYPESEHPTTGRFWTQAKLDRVRGGCRTVTWMGSALAETYAREPEFYGSTFCVGCKVHLPVGKDGEFVWLDFRGDETAERVGT